MTAEGTAQEAEGKLAAVDLSTDVAVIACPQLFSDSGRGAALPVRDTLRLGEHIALVAADARGALAAWGSVRAVGPSPRRAAAGKLRSGSSSML